MIRFGKNLRTIDQLEKQSVIDKFTSRINSVRQSFPVIVIDDKTFTPLPNLLRHNYNIVHVQDIDTIGQIENYPIVLCDLLGVGSSLSPTLQGAQIISEIKKNYPEKIVVAYTAGGYSDIYEKGIIAADHHLKKDANTEEWCDILDMAISELSNPATVWKKSRHRLLDANVTPYELAVLEDTYVGNVLQGKDALEPKLLRQTQRLNLLPAARSIIRSIIASAIFAALT